jgi:hypothetical protein
LKDENDESPDGKSLNIASPVTHLLSDPHLIFSAWRALHSGKNKVDVSNKMWTLSGIEEALSILFNNSKWDHPIFDTDINANSILSWDPKELKQAEDMLAAEMDPEQSDEFAEDSQSKAPRGKPKDKTQLKKLAGRKKTDGGSGDHSLDNGDQGDEESFGKVTGSDSISFDDDDDDDSKLEGSRNLGLDDDGPPPPPPPPADGGAEVGPDGDIPPPPPGMAPPPPPGLIPGEQRRGIKLKRFNWDKIPNHKIFETIWRSVKVDGIKLDRKILEKHFYVKEGKKSSEGGEGEGEGGRTRTVHLVDLKRANNVGILLSRLKVPLSHVRNSLEQLDPATLSLENARALRKLAPSPDEIEILKNYKGEKQVLGAAEKFFMEVCDLS